MFGIKSLMANMLGDVQPTPENLAKLIKPLLAQMGVDGETKGFVIAFSKNAKGEDTLLMEACNVDPIAEIKSMKQKVEILKMLLSVDVSDSKNSEHVETLRETLDLI